MLVGYLISGDLGGALFVGHGIASGTTVMRSAVRAMLGLVTAVVVFFRSPFHGDKALWSKVDVEGGG